MQEEVGQVALGIDDDGRGAVEGSFLEHTDTQTGLARSGHTGDHRMGCEIGRIQQQRIVGQCTRLGVKDSSKKIIRILKGHFHHLKERGFCSASIMH